MVPITVSLTYITTPWSLRYASAWQNGHADVASLASYLALPARQPCRVQPVHAALAGAERIFAVMEDTPRLMRARLTGSGVSGESGEESLGLGHTIFMRKTPLAGDVRFDVT